MLTTVALCVVALDWTEFRANFLTDKLSAELTPTVTSRDLREVLALAARGEAAVAFDAMTEAEHQVAELTGPELRNQAAQCEQEFAYVVEGEE